MSFRREPVGQAKFFGLPVAPDVTKINVATYLLGCMASVMFLVFLNASQVLSILWIDID
jgi:hypothetical protein